LERRRPKIFRRNFGRRRNPASRPAVRIAAAAGTRLNGELLAKWTLIRYEQLVATADAIAFTFLNGATEAEKKVGVVELVP
jgi:hypothetical protein